MGLRDLLLDILENGTLQAVFQPIIDLRAGLLIGYEGLIRGPSDSPLHAPSSCWPVPSHLACQVA